MKITIDLSEVKDEEFLQVHNDLINFLMRGIKYYDLAIVHKTVRTKKEVRLSDFH